MTPHAKHPDSPLHSSTHTIRIAFAAILSLLAVPAQAKVIYEDKRVICFDNGRCSRKMTQQEMDAATQYLTPEEKREYEIFRNATRNPDLLKQLLTNQPKGQANTAAPGQAQGPRREFEGVWAQTEAECQDEEGPNTRTIIDLRNKKVGALFEGYENVCRIGTIEGQNPARLLMTCAESLEGLESGEGSHHDTVTIVFQGPQSISLNGKPYVRCLR